MFVITCIITSMARNSLLCADVPLRNYSLTHASISALTTVTVNYCRAYTATCFIIAMTAVRVCACYCRVTDDRWHQTTGRKMFDFLQRCHRRGWGHVTPLLFPPRRRCRNVQRTVIVRRRTQIIYFCHSAAAGWWAGCAAETAGQ